MEKALYYLKSEYGYDEFDLYQEFRDDWESFVHKIEEKFPEEPANKEEEKILYDLIDNFMIDVRMENRRRRRAY